MSKLSIAIFLIAVILLAYFLISSGYLSAPFENRNFTTSNYSNPNFEYVNTSYPLLFQNIRWNHMPLKVFIDIESGSRLSQFSQSDVNDFRTALDNWELETDGVFSFVETNDRENADITVEWVRRLSGSGGIKTVGEGGPAVINTGLFNLTISGKIILVPGDTSCKNINVGMHEMGHVMGLDHSDDPEDVMYPYDSCSTTISPAAIRTIQELYRIQPKADLFFINATAIKSGTLMNLKFVVKNQGILNSSATSITLKSDNSEIQSLPLQILSPGEAIIFIQSIRIFRSFSEIRLAIDPNGLVDELSEDNNAITLR